MVYAISSCDIVHSLRPEYCKNAQNSFHDLSTQNFKGANEEPKSFKTVLKIPMQFWGHHQNEVNRNPGITYLKILG